MCCCDKFELLHKKLSIIELVLLQIIEKENKIMSQLDDVIKGLDTLDADTAVLVQEQTKAFKDLEDAVAKGGTTSTDLQPIIDRLQKNHVALAQALVDAQAADATTTPATPPQA